MKKRVLPALGMALCFLLTACVVDSENPLGSPESAQIDQRLLGDWVAKNGDIVHFSAKDAHWMLAVTTPKASESPDRSTANNKKPEPDLFFVTTIGGETYFNMRSVSEDSKTKYSLFWYTITPDQTLHMWGMSQDEMAAAVRAGKLKGTVQDRGATGKPPRTDVDVHLTDSSEHLVKFISRHDPADIFDDETDPLTKVATKGD
jgi:hypothetical protein